MRGKKRDIKIIEIDERICKVHPSFMTKMAKQLEESGSELLQEDIINCVCMFFVHEGEVKFDVNGDGYLKGDIINWNNFGIETTIKWSSPMKKNIYPDQDVEDLEITFSWCNDFPLEELKNNSKKKLKKVDSKTYPFSVEYCGSIGPDIRLGISMGQPEDENLKSLLIDTLVSAFRDWNSNAKETNTECIHYIGELKKKGSKYYIHFDFGNCDIKALEFVITSLANKFNKSNISKITIE